MPSDFDKTIGDKLGSYEAAFNPADWQNMEAMLPQDSRQPFLLIALVFGLLMLGIGGLLMNNILTSTGAEKISTTAAFEKGNELEPGYGGMKYASDETRHPMTASPITKQDSPLENEKAESKNHHAGEQVAGQEVEREKSKEKNHETHPSIKESKTKNHPVAKGQSGRKEKGLTRNQNNLSDVARKSEAIESSLPPIENEAELLARLSAELIKTEVNGVQTPSAEAMKSVLKKKRKVFEFSLGIGAGPTFSFTGIHYQSKPGYSAGISQEFMFIKRIGLVLSESYVQRKYNGGQYPCPAGAGSDCPRSYSSEVRSIDFGMNVKANLVHHARWDWYAEAGVVNVLKLKETFEYTYPDIDTVTPPPPPKLPSVSSNTNFSGAPQTENFDASLTNSTAKSAQPDLTISGTKRYHIAYHVATGFDIALNSRLKLQIETGYSFTRPTVGENEKRLHTLGVNGRLFYVFGK